MGVKQAYDSFFRTVSPREEQARTDAIQLARATIRLHDDVAFRALLSTVRDLRDAPIATGGDIASLSGAIGRQNGIKEILKMIDSDLKRAKNLVDEIEGVTRG